MIYVDYNVDKILINFNIFGLFKCEIFYYVLTNYFYFFFSIFVVNDCLFYNCFGKCLPSPDSFVFYSNLNNVKKLRKYEDYISDKRGPLPDLNSIQTLNSLK
jgi:hypothetical protein